MKTYGLNRTQQALMPNLSDETLSKIGELESLGILHGEYTQQVVQDITGAMIEVNGMESINLFDKCLLSSLHVMEHLKNYPHMRINGYAVNYTLKVLQSMVMGYYKYHVEQDKHFNLGSDEYVPQVLALCTLDPYLLSYHLDTSKYTDEWGSVHPSMRLRSDVMQEFLMHHPDKAERIGYVIQERELTLSDEDALIIIEYLKDTDSAPSLSDGFL